MARVAWGLAMPLTQLLDGLGNDVWPFIASIIMWRIWNACNSYYFEVIFIMGTFLFLNEN
jgi:hypothetical protein